MSTFLDSLNGWLKKAMGEDDRILILGEDIIDPYGGAFKVTRGLSSAFSGRVLTTPISEAGIVGVATGMALRGFKPVVEIMFGDFSSLVVDQVINHLAKFRALYTEGNPLQMVIRTPMGGRRGYGPTHSQSLERLFLGTPSLTVIAPANIIGAAGELIYQSLLYHDEPVFFVENKLQYLLELIEEGGNDEIVVTSFPGSPRNSKDLNQYFVSIRGAPKAEITIITYGYMVELARQAMLELAYNDEIFVNICVITQLSPFSIPVNFKDLINNNPLLILEEGPLSWGWGAEVMARLCDYTIPGKVKISRLAAKDQIIPASPSLERDIFPQVGDIINAIKRLRGHS